MFDINVMSLYNTTFTFCIEYQWSCWRYCNLLRFIWKSDDFLPTTAPPSLLMNSSLCVIVCFVHSERFCSHHFQMGRKEMGLVVLRKGNMLFLLLFLFWGSEMEMLVHCPGFPETSFGSGCVRLSSSLILSAVSFSSLHLEKCKTH